MATVRAEIALTMPAAYNRFAHTFTHIFCAGYAAGYYGYMWAAVLASDAFSRFAEEGLYSREVGQAFRETVLGRGGAESASVLFKRFRGREPRIDALLHSNGLK
nr:M3 family metallopeptidase [uncultured Pseudomonas sp.]